MSRKLSYVLTFVVMFLFWILLSAWQLSPDTPGKFDFIHISQGVAAAAITTYLSRRVLFDLSKKWYVKFIRAIPYIAWELWQIVLANLDVAYRALHPKMPLDPVVVEFETPLRSDLALTFMANSITLTPGTITIMVEPEKGKFVVHAIDKKLAEPLVVDQTMQRKLAYVFMEGQHDSPS